MPAMSPATNANTKQTGGRPFDAHWSANVEQTECRKPITIVAVTFPNLAAVTADGPSAGRAEASQRRRAAPDVVRAIELPAAAADEHWRYWSNSCAGSVCRRGIRRGVRDTDQSICVARQPGFYARRTTALARCRKRVRSAATRRERACGTLPPWPRNSPDFIASLQPEQLHATSVHSVRGDTRSDTREPGNGVQRWLSPAIDDTQRPVNPGPPSTEAPFFGRPSSRGTSGTPHSRPTEVLGGRAAAPRQTRHPTTATSRPGSRRAAASTDSARTLDGCSRPHRAPLVSRACEPGT
jgi:hypothetical protein